MRYMGASASVSTAISCVYSHAHGCNCMLQPRNAVVTAWSAVPQPRWAHRIPCCHPGVQHPWAVLSSARSQVDVSRSCRPNSCSLHWLKGSTRPRSDSPTRSPSVPSLGRMWAHCEGRRQPSAQLGFTIWIAPGAFAVLHQRCTGALEAALMERTADQKSSGGCLCGAVRFTVDLASQQTLCCHCRQCQLSTSAPFWACTTVCKSQLQLSGDVRSCLSCLAMVAEKTYVAP